MKATRFIQSAMVAAVLTAGTSLAVAQNSQVPGSTKDPYAQQKDKMAKGQQAAPKLRRVSEITGKLGAGTNVVGSDNQKIGDINHLAIDLNSGKCAFAVISSGGVAGVGGEWRAVPLKALKFSELNDPARLNITKTEFDAAPTIDKDSWNQLNDVEYRKTTYRHYKIEIDDDGDIERKMEKKTEVRGGAPGSNFVRSDTAIGMKVANPQNENLGDVNDLVADLTSCKVVYAVLGFGGFLGMGEKLFAVPWQALNLDRSEKQFVINIDKDRLRDAPGFDRDKWPDMADIRWTQDVHAFYGTQPDWVYGYVGEGNVPEQGRASERSRGWEYNSEYNRMFKTDGHETFTGTITNVDRTAPMRNMSEAVILNLRTNDGQTMPVHVGPAWFIDHQPVRFNNNDQVTVTGSRATIDGKPCIIASEIKGSNFTMTLRHKDGSPMWAVYRATGSGGDRNNNRDR